MGTPSGGIGGVVLHGMEAQPHSGSGCPSAGRWAPPMQQQHLALVRGVQDAVAGELAIRFKTLPAGVEAVGTCDTVWEGMGF